MLKHSINILLHKVTGGSGLLQMRVFWEGGGKLSLNIGYRVEVAKWDGDTQRCIRNTSHGRKAVPASEINRRINQWEDAVEAVFDTIGRNDNITPAEAKQKIHNYLGIQSDNYVVKSEGTTMVDTIYKYLQSESVTRGLAHKTRQGYMTLASLFKQYKGGIICVEHFDKKEYSSFYNSLLNDDKAGSTIQALFTFLNSVLHWAEKSGYNVPADWADCKPKVARLPKTIVYLTWRELMQAYQFACNTDEFSGHQLDMVYMFLLSCFTGLRVSDLRNLKKSDIRNDCINVATIKTDKVVSINLNQYSRSIVDRYIGREKDDVYLFPKTDEFYSPVLSRFLRSAGITEKVTLTYYKGGRRCEETRAKCDCITMHCGRRTFITNAISMGIPPNVVMQWTGHSDYKAMLPYIAITNQAKRDAMSLFDAQ